MIGNTMGKKQLILLIFAVLGVFCAHAQLRLDPATYDFGTLREEGGKVFCTFRATNEGTKPIIIADIVTTCGCTVPIFSRQPLLAGRTTEIKVSYDPAGRPGAFDRKLYIYGASKERLGEVSIKGVVTPRPRSVEELYPIEAGGGVRLNTTHCAFTYIYVGRTIQSAISLVNTSSEPRTIEVELRKGSGLLAVDAPKVLQPGERSAINFSYTIPASEPRYGTIEDVMTLRVEGRASEKVLLTHGIAIDPRTKMSEEKPPKVEMSENILKFGAVKHDGEPRRLSFEVTNIGSSELKIRALECDPPFHAKLSKQSLGVGEKARCEVELRPREGEYGFVMSQLRIITNDPEHPVRRLRVNAIVED